MARKRILTEDGPVWVDDTFGPEGNEHANWGTVGPQMYQRTNEGAEAVNEVPQRVQYNGREYHRVGNWLDESGKPGVPKYAQGKGFEQHMVFDPTNGWLIPQDIKDQIDALSAEQDGFLDKYGAFLPMAGLGGIAAAHALAGGAAAAGGASGGSFSGSFAPTITPSTVAAADLGVTLGAPAASMPSVAGLSGVGALTAEGASALGAMGSAGAGLGLGATGPLGAMTLDAAGNIVPSLVDLANSTGVLPGGIPSLPNAPTTSTGGTSAGGTSTPSGTTPGGTAASQSALGQALKAMGIDVSDDILSLIGKGLGIGAGLYGANQQAEAKDELFDKFFGMGQPYRNDLLKLNADPMSFYSSPMVQGALQQGSDALARSLSAKGGNPWGNPTALQEMQNYTTRGLLDAYNNRFSQLAGAGQLGVSQSAPLGLQAADAQGDVGYTAGMGIRSVFGGDDSAQQLAELLRNNQNSGLSGLLR